MKNIFLSFVFVGMMSYMAMQPMQAQRPVGDTIRGHEPTYMDDTIPSNCIFHRPTTGYSGLVGPQTIYNDIHSHGILHLDGNYFDSVYPELGFILADYISFLIHQCIRETIPRDEKCDQPIP